MIEHILSSIVFEYDNLLSSYERVYESLKSTECRSIDDYIIVLGNVSEYITSINEIQDNIHKLRGKLKTDIHSDLLIDSVLDGYSKGRIEYINSRISHVIQYLKVFEQSGRAVLRHGNEGTVSNFNEVYINKC